MSKKFYVDKKNGGDVNRNFNGSTDKRVDIQVFSSSASIEDQNNNLRKVERALETQQTVEILTETYEKNTTSSTYDCPGQNKHTVSCLSNNG